MSPQDKFQTTRKELADSLIERDEETVMALTALLANELDVGVLLMLTIPFPAGRSSSETDSFGCVDESFTSRIS